MLGVLLSEGIISWGIKCPWTLGVGRPVLYRGVEGDGEGDATHEGRVGRWKIIPLNVIKSI